MPTVPRRPAGQRERDRLQARRLCGAEVFAAGVRQAESPASLRSRRRRLASGTPAGRRACRWAAQPRTQRSWLVVERLPASAPELNPTEGLWSSLKAVELANLVSPTLAEVIDQAHRGIDRVRRTPHLAYSFLRHAGLSVS